MADPRREAEIVRRLLETLGLPYSDLTDTAAKYGKRETGADVEIRHEGRTVGVQVTEFRVDEGITDPQRSLRATEARNAADGQAHTYALPLSNQRAALRLRVLDKIQKASEFEEVWLVVVASVADERAAAATCLVDPFMNADVLNVELDRSLQASKYKRAYLYPMLGAKIYEWSRESKWRCVYDESPAPPSLDEILRYFRNPGLVGDVPPHPNVVERMCAVCGGPFVREQPRREPARPDGRYIHADEEFCARLQRVTVWRDPGRWE